MVRREIWPNLKNSNISETKEAIPTKLGACVHLINIYLHEIFELFKNLRSQPIVRNVDTHTHTLHSSFTLSLCFSESSINWPSTCTCNVAYIPVILCTSIQQDQLPVPVVT